jgi:hypothetical protein
MFETELLFYSVGLVQRSCDFRYAFERLTENIEWKDVIGLGIEIISSSIVFC